MANVPIGAPATGLDSLITDKASSSGISASGLDNLMTDIVDYAERTNEILNGISDLVAGTSSYFVCESGNQFREQFEIVKANFTTMNKNILEYNTDLLDVKVNYANRVEYISQELYSAEQAVNSKGNIGLEGGEK